MTTTTVTTHRVRSDIADTPTADSASAPTRPSTRWALAGLGAGLSGVGAIVSATLVDAVYQEDLAGDSVAIAAELEGQVPQMIAFHTFATISAALMIVFAAGLYRRLRATAPAHSLAPLIAFAGLLGTSVVLMLGSGLDTEFVFGFIADKDVVDPANAALYNSWVGTVAWCWGLLGLSGIAVHSVARAGGVPRWLGRVGLFGGGLTLLLGISLQQYMAGFTGPLGLTVVALGFLVGDKLYRRA